MPKEYLVINKFHGGLNSAADPEEISEDQCSDIKNMQIDELGTLRPMGSVQNHATFNDTCQQITKGYGVHYMPGDYTDGHTTSAQIIGKTIAFVDGGGGNDTITDSDDRFLLSGFQIGQTISVTGSSSNNISNKVITNVAAGTLTFATGTVSSSEGAGAKVTIKTVNPGASGASDYFFIASNNNQLHVYSSEDDTERGIFLNGDRILHGYGSATGTLPSFFNIDGALRICDGNFSDNHSSIWYGHIKRTLFPDATNGSAPLSIDGWYMRDSRILSWKEYEGIHTSDPATSNHTGTSDSKYWQASISVGSWPAFSNHTLNETVVNGFFVQCDAPLIARAHMSDDDGEGTWSGNEQFYFSYIYDETQESKLVSYGPVTTSATARGSKRFRVSLNPDEVPFQNPRITGYRVYYSKATGTIPQGDIYLILEIDFVKGVRDAYEGEWDPWGDTISDLVTQSNYVEYHHVPTVKTYESLNNHSPYIDSESDVHLHARYKTAVIANRRAYIGNIHQNGVSLGDAMIKSPVNEFDKYPESNKMEVTIGDGDEIVKLASYADRILQFKKNKLHVINVSQEMEYLESTHHYQGVSHPAAVTTTNYGIVWANEGGCYLYNGETINDLLAKDGLDVIKRSDWASFISSPIVGYDSGEQVVHVLGNPDAADDENGVMYFYNMLTLSWTKSCEDSAYTTTNVFNPGADANAEISNMVTSGDGEVVWMYQASSSGTSSMKRFMPYGNGSHELDVCTWVSKAFNFGTPTEYKRLYGFRVTYVCPGGASNVTLQYSANNGASFSNIGSALASASSKGVYEFNLPNVIKFRTLMIKVNNPDDSNNTRDGFRIYNISALIRRLKTRGQVNP